MQKLSNPDLQARLDEIDAQGAIEDAKLRRRAAIIEDHFYKLKAVQV